MARQQHLGGSEDWFVGEDKTLEFEIYDSTGAAIQDVSGWAIQWVMRKVFDGNAIVISKTTGAGTITITGSYNSDPDVNTQRVAVAITDDDTDNLQPGQYEHALKRTTSGSETVLSYGQVHLKKAAL